MHQFQAELPHHLPVRVDKYPLLYVVAPVVTFYRLILHVFTSAPNYRKLVTCKSTARAHNVLLLYYHLCFRVYPEILNHMSPMHHRNNWSIQIPTLKGIAIKAPERKGAALGI